MQSHAPRKWPLYPREELVWEGRPELGVARDPLWRASSALLFGASLIAVLFAALNHSSGVRAGPAIWLTAIYFAVLFILSLLLPRYLFDRCEFAISDRRVFWRRGLLSRSMERTGITLTRIQWHPSASGVGSLELIRALPFGPLMRNQRIVMHDLREPDVVLGSLRGQERALEHSGDHEVPFAERLERGEVVIWGGAPASSGVDWRERGIALLGLLLLVLALRYGASGFAIVLGLENAGLPLGGVTWLLLFSAIALSFAMMSTVGGTLVWFGTVRARALATDTEYIVTDRRVLLRRGRVELSVDRDRIVDLAERPASGGRVHVVLLLDGPEGRALGMFGALATLLPAKDSVPPILFDLPDAHELRAVLFEPSGNAPKDRNVSGEVP